MTPEARRKRDELADQDLEFNSCYVGECTHKEKMECERANYINAWDEGYKVRSDEAQEGFRKALQLQAERDVYKEALESMLEQPWSLGPEFASDKLANQALEAGRNIRGES